MALLHLMKESAGLFLAIFAFLCCWTCNAVFGGYFDSFLLFVVAWIKRKPVDCELIMITWNLGQIYEMFCWHYFLVLIIILLALHL